MPTQAAIYVRVSSIAQEEHGSSLGTQEESCRAYAAAQGYVVRDAQVYRETHTGVVLWERAELTRLREALRLREVGVVICHAIDRLSRDPVHLGLILTEADHVGVSVHFVTEALDDTPEGPLIRFVRGYAAKLEHAKIVERTQRGRRARVVSGKPLHSRTLAFGYRWADEEKSRYEADPVTAPFVRRVFTAIAGGATLGSQAALLDDSGIAPPRGGRCWHVSVLSRLVRNPTYSGAAAFFKTVTKDGRQVARPRDEWIIVPSEAVPALVDQATFAAVQEQLRLNKAQAPRRLVEPERFLLRGFARCGYCGNALSVITRPQGVHEVAPQPVYRCNAHPALHVGIPRPAIQTALLDALVWERVTRELQDPAVVDHELARLRLADPTEPDAQVVERERAAVVRRRDNLVSSIETTDDADTRATLTVRLRALVEQIRRLDTERQAVGERRARWLAAQTRLDSLQAWVHDVGTRLAALPQEQRLDALAALAVDVRLYAHNHAPRLEITTSIPAEATLDFPSRCRREDKPYLLLRWVA